MTSERFPSGQREQTVNLSANAFGGSNPPLSTILWIGTESNAGIAQLARASAFQAEGRGFESRFPLHDCNGAINRPRSSGVERFLGKEEVIGSNPIVGSNLVREF